MDTQITPEIENQLRELCGEISVAQTLDEEVLEELYGHLEDKYLAYINEEEKIGPQDAVILVREHFGDASAVQELLRDVHGRVPGVPFWRTIIAIATAYHGGRTILLCLILLLHYSINNEIVNNNSLFLNHTFTILSKGYIYIPPLILLLVLHAWRRKLKIGKTIWFQKYSISFLIGFTIACMFTSIWLQQQKVNVFFITPDHFLLYPYDGFLSFVIPIFFIPYVWVWWVKRVHSNTCSDWWIIFAWIGYNLIDDNIWNGFKYEFRERPFSGLILPFGEIFMYMLFGALAVYLFSFQDRLFSRKHHAFNKKV